MRNKRWKLQFKSKLRRKMEKLSKNILMTFILKSLRMNIMKTKIKLLRNMCQKYIKKLFLMRNMKNKQRQLKNI